MTSALVSTRATDLIGITPLMELSSGVPEVLVGLLDGPVSLDHPDLASTNIHEAPSTMGCRCSQDNNAACQHGTFVAGILGARRGCSAPGICPGCTLLVRPIFKETLPDKGTMPGVTPKGLAKAIVECIDEGAWVLNLSAAFAQPSTTSERLIEEALDYALRRGVIVVAAAGNQGALGSSAITCHPWVIPVVGCGLNGRPTKESNLGSSVGKRGLMAPGETITSLAVKGESLRLGGTSVAAPFVTGTIALLWSMFPTASATEVKSALTGGLYPRRRTSVVPPLLDAQAAYRAMARTRP